VNAVTANFNTSAGQTTEMPQRKNSVWDHKVIRGYAAVR